MKGKTLMNWMHFINLFIKCTNGNDLTLTTFQTFYLSHNNVICVNYFIL